MHIEYTLNEWLQEGFTAGFHVPLTTNTCTYDRSKNKGIAVHL